MGTDKGEWGGECSYMALRTGKVHAVASDVSGVLGFLRLTDGRLFSYGGTSHLGMHTGYIAQIRDGHLDDISQFESDNWKQSVPEKTRQIISQLKKATAQAPVGSSDDKPRAPIDLVVEDFDKLDSGSFRRTLCTEPIRDFRSGARSSILEEDGTEVDDIPWATLQQSTV
jgi:hypothetical protein